MDMSIPFHFLEQSTEGFSDKKMIGSGSYGNVYKGVYNGEDIAVKWFTNMIDKMPFENEFFNILRIQHPNVVRFIGYCYETKNKLVEHNGLQQFCQHIYRILCFELPQGGSLDKYLNESRDHDWPTRYNIIKGTCEGLNFLHGGSGSIILHLDLKPESVLLDKEMRAKIADFELARFFSKTQTHITDTIIGTEKYMPPEYRCKKQISPKNDVYSLGVIIIDILAGHTGYYEFREMDDVKPFIEHVITNWREWIYATTSPFPSAELDQVKTCIKIAIKCVDPESKNRPTVAEILDNLQETEKSFHLLGQRRSQTPGASSAGITSRSRQETKVITNWKETENKILVDQMRSLQFLKDITNNFSEKRILGQGGSGVVYRGELQNGKFIAVKKVNTMRISEELCEKSRKLFENEIALLMGLEHPNIVQLLNYCYGMKADSLLHGGIFCWQIDTLLCLEYLPEGSLDNRISDATSGLDWRTRYKIIEGISNGLRYLHEQPDAPIIHLDLKPANILLDANMVPKIADFGISRLYNEGKTIHTKSNDGTPGYMAPEYILRGLITRDTIKRGIITPMSDIFSLGVIIMEIITGHKEYPFDINEATSQEFIHNELGEWRTMLKKKTWNANLETDCQQIEKCIQIGLECVNHDRTKRPTIREITNMLEALESTNC